MAVHNNKRASGPEAVLSAVSAATSTIPIATMAVNYDPVAKGYVNSLVNSGNNSTVSTRNSRPRPLPMTCQQFTSFPIMCKWED